MATYIFQSATSDSVVQVDFGTTGMVIRHRGTGENLVADYQNIRVASMIPMESDNFGVVFMGRLATERCGDVRLRTTYTMVLAKGTHSWDKSMTAVRKTFESNTGLRFSRDTERKLGERLVR